MLMNTRFQAAALKAGDNSPSLLNWLTGLIVALHLCLFEREALAQGKRVKLIRRLSFVAHVGPGRASASWQHAHRGIVSALAASIAPDQDKRRFSWQHGNQFPSGR
jgi:hypothetical protein